MKYVLGFLKKDIRQLEDIKEYAQENNLPFGKMIDGHIDEVNKAISILEDHNDRPDKF